MGEIWKSVVGYEGLYEVSDKGRIRSLDRVVELELYGAVRRQLRRGRILKPQLTPKGYLQVCLYRDRVRSTTYVHQLVARSFLGHTDSLEVNHKNGDKTDNAVANLELVSHQENIEHSYRQLGRVGPNRKLTNEEVREIRKSDLSCSAISKRYKVHQMTISNIRRGECYAEVV